MNPVSNRQALGRKAGDAAIVVHFYPGAKAHEVEFVALDGPAAAVAILEAAQVRPVTAREIVHARELVKV